MTRGEIDEFSTVGLYCFETDREERWYQIGCIDGLEAADEEPNISALWHDASEIPQSNHKNIIYQTNYCSMYNVHIDFIPTCLRSCKITSCSWNEYVKEVNMRRWAYISDLIPKGGE